MTKSIHHNEPALVCPCCGMAAATADADGFYYDNYAQLDCGCDGYVSATRDGPCVYVFDSCMCNPFDTNEGA